MFIMGDGNLRNTVRNTKGFESTSKADRSTRKVASEVDEEIGPSRLLSSHGMPAETNSRVASLVEVGQRFTCISGNGCRAEKEEEEEADKRNSRNERIREVVGIDELPPAMVARVARSCAGRKTVGGERGLSGVSTAPFRDPEKSVEIGEIVSSFDSINPGNPNGNSKSIEIQMERHVSLRQRRGSKLIY